MDRQNLGRGVAWSALNAGTLRLGQFAMSIVIARLVAPQQFGVFVVALTVYTIIVNVSDVGVGTAIVRDVERSREIAPTVASLSIGFSAVLAGIMMLSAPMLAQALGARDAADAVRVLALTVLLGGAGAVPAALLTRDYLQGRRFAVDGATFIVSNGVLVVAALCGGGVMALAWSRVIGQLVSTVALFLLAPERYRPHFDPSTARQLLRFGLPLAGANLIAFVIGNVDFVVVGRVLGATRLGLYNLAYTVSGWPVSIFTAILNNVTLTTLARARDDGAELEMHLQYALAALSAASFPVSAICAGLAGPLVDTIYGNRWHPAAAALLVLAVFGSIRVVISLLSDLLVALGQTRRLMGLQVLWIVALVPAMIVGVRSDGIVGAGVAHVAVGACVVLPAYLLTLGRLGVGTSWVRRATLRPLASSVVAGLGAHLVTAWITPAPLALLAGGSAGAALYCACAGRWLTTLVGGLRSTYGSAVAAPSTAGGRHRWAEPTPNHRVAVSR